MAQGPLPSAGGAQMRAAALALKALRWLVKGCRVDVSFAMLEHVDAPNEVIAVSKWTAPSSPWPAPPRHHPLRSTPHPSMSTGSYRPGGRHRSCAPTKELRSSRHEHWRRQQRPRRCGAHKGPQLYRRPESSQE